MRLENGSRNYFKDDQIEFHRFVGGCLLLWFSGKTTCGGFFRVCNMFLLDLAGLRQHDRRHYRLILLITMAIHIGKPSNSQLAGTVSKCNKEGEPVNIPGITDDPCISCVCRKGQVECEKTKCKALEGCHAILFDGPSRKCCDTCKGCWYNGSNYDSTSTWSNPTQPCEEFSCRAGVVTKSKKKCYVPCKHPTMQRGRCCPSCTGCFYSGKEYKDGDEFSLTTDPCVKCTCEKGNMTCVRHTCAVLNCPKESVHKPEGECCPQCKGMRRIFDLPTSCYFAKRVFSNGSTFQPEKCTECMCLEGTSVCDKITCPPIDCAPDDRIEEPGACCQKCKPKRNCIFQGQGYKHHEEWRPSICTHCTCDDGVTYCQRERCSNALWCPQGYKLKFEPGSCCPKCTEHDAVCTVFGDPHYRTFDGKMYNFQGSCKYLLAKDCKGREFTIKVRNGVRLSSGFAWTQMLVILLGKSRISFLQNLVVKIDRKRVVLPHVVPGHFSVRRDGHSVTFKSDVGLKVVWDGDSFLEVTASSRFKNRLCGLCGNYNGQEADDLTGKDKRVYLHGEEFGHSWRIGSKKACKVKPMLRRLRSPCDKDFHAKIRANRHCNVLYSRIFAKCRKEIKVHPYITSCVTDMCDCPAGRQCSCESIRAYAHECARAEFEIDWEKDSACTSLEKPSCPKGAVFSKCAPACHVTCKNYTKVKKCSKLCVAGCVCKKGRVFHKNRCIPIGKCSRKKPVSSKTGTDPS
ncbi:BMP-binding endothelial regulator protein-like [Gigantopelta aegis]|uniref:BMP-binding endothelial regulator protein-like n=1 Tax=Gigantopelta aegis TaxID=1735272 RepID=UPI001B88870F|nr:BMP-binding endothelial regulator protein-like [Gigantopelta aegis]